MNYREHREPDDRIVEWFQPDTLVPAQFLDLNRRSALLQPEKLLMLAVLEDGINHFQKHLFAATSKRKRLFQEASEWIFDMDGGDVFSFSHICEVLGFDPNYIRRGLVLWSNVALPRRLRRHVDRAALEPRRVRSIASRRRRYVPKLFRPPAL